MIVAVSAPTALAVRMAEAAGMTLVAIARKDGFEVFTHPHRVKWSTLQPRRVKRQDGCSPNSGEGNEIHHVAFPDLAHILGDFDQAVGIP